MSITLRILVLGDAWPDPARPLAVLRTVGYEPVFHRADNPAEYLSHLTQEVDVILASADSLHPDCLTALHLLQERDLNIPFIVVTPVPAPETTLECLRLGATDYVPSGRADRLVVAIERALRRRRLLADKRRAHDSLAQAARHWEAVFDAVNDAITVLREDGTILRCNAAMSRLAGLPKSALIGSSCWAIVHGAPSPPDDCPLARIRETRARNNTVLTIRGRWYQETTDPLFDTAGRIAGAVVVLADISERKQTEEQVRAQTERLHSLSRQLLEVQEHERRAIAKELHDEIGQALTAVHINLQSARHAAGSTDLDANLADSIALVEQTLQQVRDLSLDLRPSLLDDLGLVAALRWYVERYGRRTGLETSFSADAIPGRLRPDLETACFRVAQEALTNIARHAQAHRVSVRLRYKDNSLELSIQDDGIGFDPQRAREQASGGQSLGLLNMEERVLLAGGELSITSAAGGGTEVLARFPGVQAEVCE